jgi:hypothetical protein
MAVRIERSKALTLLVVAALVSMPGVVAADGTKASPPAASSSSDQLAERAFKAYEANDFAAAIDLYLTAFQLSGDARILFNVAAIYDRKLHDRKAAEDYYLRYLKSPSTEPELVRKASERLVGMRDEEATPAKPPVQPEPAPAPPAPKPNGLPPLRTVAISAAVAGGVALGVGAIFGVSALSKASDLSSQCPNDVCPSQDGVRLRDSAATAATLSTVFVVVGIALLAGGGAAYLLDPARRSAWLQPRPAFGVF